MPPDSTGRGGKRNSGRDRAPGRPLAASGRATPYRQETVAAGSPNGTRSQPRSKPRPQRDRRRDAGRAAIASILRRG
jgi:hypothetical protein